MGESAAVYSDRINNLPPYLFARLDEMKQEVEKSGVDIVDLGIGDPDLETPGHIVHSLQQAAVLPENHRYASYKGLQRLRESFADWYKRRFGVILDAATEVLPLLGSKEGIGHIPLAFLNRGDTAIVPDPAYPVYRAGVILAGGDCYSMRLLPEKGFLPDLGAIPADVARKAKLMFVNYPNNPTSGVATKAFFSDVVEFAKNYDILVCHDAAYSEICYDGYIAPSLLEIEGAGEIAVEFHSLSKTYNMTGWRIGCAVGNSEILNGLGKVKTNLDSGIFQPVQYAGIEALNGDQQSYEKTMQIYAQRREILVNGLNKIGWHVPKPLATFFVWAPVLPGYDSMSMVTALLESAGVVTTPGVGFGKGGEGFVRMSLTTGKENLAEAVRRIGKWKSELH